jgi:uncharacterized protein
VIFVDTGAWFATFVPSDSDHEAAKAWHTFNTEPLVTTDDVIDELLTLLRIRGEYQRALRLGQYLLREEICDLELVSPIDVQRAWHVFSTYQDKQWSFTDCVSHVVMGRLGLSTAFAFDEHFRQFGTVLVVPQVEQ